MSTSSKIRQRTKSTPSLLPLGYMRYHSLWFSTIQRAVSYLRCLLLPVKLSPPCSQKNFPNCQPCALRSSNRCTPKPFAYCRRAQTGVTRQSSMATDALRRTSPVALRSGHVGAMDSRTRFRDVASACTKLPPNTLIDGEVRTDGIPSMHYSRAEPMRIFKFWRTRM